MSFYGALLIWFVIAALMVTGVVLAVKVSFFFLLVPLGLFAIAFTKFGCLLH